MLTRSALSLCKAPRPFTRSFASPATGSKKLWGGRFTKDTNPAVEEWVNAIPIDSNLWREDIWGSLAHTTMLGQQGIIPQEDARKILAGLIKIQDDIEAGKLTLGTDQDDVHMDVESKLIKTIGPEAAGRMHTCRSRNDQGALDSKLYCRRRILELRGRLITAIGAFLKRAETGYDDVMVAYTHVQHAQPISIAYWLSHYAAVLLRDLDRLVQAYNVTDTNPLGGGAIAGTSFPIDRELTTLLMGFQGVQDHGLDGTSARDYFLESISGNSIVMTTLSRLAEELILWSSWEFRSITLDDGFAMGSSMMPQKKNPGPLELMRGRTGRVHGYTMAGLTMLKGLPSGYNRDFHEDKEILVGSFDLTNRAVGIVPALIETMTINKKRMEELAGANFATATELANYLVLKHKVPFRDAHHVVGSLVGELVRMDSNLTNTDYCMKHLEKKGIKAPREEVLAVLDPKKVMASYNCLGGTGPKAVRNMIKTMHDQLNSHEVRLAVDNDRVSAAYLLCQKIGRGADKFNFGGIKAVARGQEPFN